MKSYRQRWSLLLAIGLLCISAPLLSNYVVTIDKGLTDFFIGIGTALAIGSLFVARNAKKCIEEPAAN